MAYEALYGPLGPERDDHLTAITAATVAATTSKKPIDASKFMPDWQARGEVDGGDDP
ncbi:MAG: hypothetical protein IRZ07_03435 [Microbispora sp.]|nr:hypothetical protein [Microbispora sp.]